MESSGQGVNDFILSWVLRDIEGTSLAEYNSAFAENPSKNSGRISTIPPIFYGRSLFRLSPHEAPHE
jgi:hypothetical protein